MTVSFFKIFMVGAFGVLLLLVSGCGSNPPSVAEDVPAMPLTYQLVETSHEAKPAWTHTPPESEGGVDYFVGLSNFQVTEQGAREEAMRTARAEFAKYTGVDFEAISEEIELSYGQASEVEDPTQSARRREKEEVYAVFGRMKAKTHYIEKYRQIRGKAQVGIAYKVWTLASIPSDELAKVQAWRTAQEKEARAYADTVLKETMDQVEALRLMLPSPQPIVLLRKIQNGFNLVDKKAKILKARGWPFDRYAADVQQLQSRFLALIPDVLAPLEYDRGRYSGTVYLPVRADESRSEPVAVPVWVYSKAKDGQPVPVIGLPLELYSTNEGERIASAITGPPDGQAVFQASGLPAGQYLVGIDAQHPDVASLDYGIRKALATRQTALFVADPGQTLGEAVNVAVRLLYAGPGRQPLGQRRVFLGAVTVGDAQETSRKGGELAKLLKDRLREKLTLVDGVTVVDPRTRTLQRMAQAIKTRDLLNRGMQATGNKPDLSDPSTQALVDGADEALEPRFSLEEEKGRLVLHLKNAGKAEVLRSSVVSVPFTMIPRGMEVRPPGLPEYEPPKIVNAAPIHIEITSHLGEGETYVQGDEVTYYITTDKDAYLLLLYENAQGSVVQLLPNPYSSPRAFYRAGRLMRIPDETTDDFGFQVSPPYGMERMWVFASSRPFPILDGQQYDSGKMLSQKMDAILNGLTQFGNTGRVQHFGYDYTTLTTVHKP